MRPSECNMCGERGMVHSTATDESKSIRYRVCRGCGHRWPTIEVRSDYIYDLEKLAKLAQKLVEEING